MTETTELNEFLKLNIHRLLSHSVHFAVNSNAEGLDILTGCGDLSTVYTR